MKYSFVGDDGRERTLLKVIKDGSLVAIGYKGYAKDVQNKNGEQKLSKRDQV